MTARIYKHRCALCKTGDHHETIVKAWGHVCIPCAKRGGITEDEPTKPVNEPRRGRTRVCTRCEYWQAAPGSELCAIDCPGL